MEEIEAFITHEIHGNINKMILDARQKQKQSAFNLFSISSYNSHYENYHSDIIAALLESTHGHEENEKFFHLFIDYLNTQEGININKLNYAFYEVTREEGRVDIAIWDTKSKKCILIENKINNAGDMDNQLLRYYDYATSFGFEVELVVYLSLDGTKRAPSFNEIKCPVLNLAAFNNSNSDLANGWLNQCINTSTNDNSGAFLREYKKLLQHLNSKAMENNAIAQFYDLINKNNAIKTIDQIIELNNQIPKHRMEKLMGKIHDYSPFRKSDRYYPNYQIFDNYNDGKFIYKLDFLFKADGSAQLEFWIPNLKDKDIHMSNATIKSKLEEIDAKEIFDIENHVFKKVYRIGDKRDEFSNMNLIDVAIYNDISLLLEKLRKHEKRN